MDTDMGTDMDIDMDTDINTDIDTDMDMDTDMDTDTNMNIASGVRGLSCAGPGRSPGTFSGRSEGPQGPGGPQGLCKEREGLFLSACVTHAQEPTCGWRMDYRLLPKRTLRELRGSTSRPSGPLRSYRPPAPPPYNDFDAGEVDRL